MGSIQTHLTSLAFSKLFDHTLLKANASKIDIENLCAQAIEGNFFSVCVLPRWVKHCSEILKTTDIRVCTVVGFPLGGNTLEIKKQETIESLKNGATEIDMVIDCGALASGNLDFIHEEISSIQNIVASEKNSQEKILKVIIETAHWSRDQIKSLGQVVCDHGCAFVKTSTGFSTRGASPEDIQDLYSVTQKTQTKIKASGGIKTLEQVLALNKLGAARIGSSSSHEIRKEFQKKCQA
jgi:deoxyribose-phosphate aldolase